MSDLNEEERMIRVCKGCMCEVTAMGEDGIDVCTDEGGGCGIVEGYTTLITESEYEAYHTRS